MARPGSDLLFLFVCTFALSVLLASRAVGGLPAGIPFPSQNRLSGGRSVTVRLSRTQTYLVASPISWTGVREVRVLGDGATVFVKREVLDSGPVFSLEGGTTWIWDAVVLELESGPVVSPHALLAMRSSDATRAGYFQSRACRWQTDNTAWLDLDRTVTTLVLETNVFEGVPRVIGEAGLDHATLLLTSMRRSGVPPVRTPSGGWPMDDLDGGDDESSYNSQQGAFDHDLVFDDSDEKDPADDSRRPPPTPEYAWDIPSSSFESQQTSPKFTWNENVWKSGYDFSTPLPAQNVDVSFSNNRWARPQPLHTSWLQAGISIHDPGASGDATEDGDETNVMCGPPTTTTTTDLLSFPSGPRMAQDDTSERTPGWQTQGDPPAEPTHRGACYAACTDAWFQEALGRSDGPTCIRRYRRDDDGILGDGPFAETIYIERTRVVDMRGGDWPWRSTWTAPGCTIKVLRLDGGFGPFESVDFYLTRDGSVDLRDLRHSPDHNIRINIVVGADTSHFFLASADVRNASIIVTGLGHMHLEESTLMDSTVSAGVVWARANRFVRTNVVVQPYSGHMRESQMIDSIYYVSPFYLGKEPYYRLQFGQNVWRGLSDVYTADGVAEGRQILMDGDTFERPELYRTLLFSEVLRLQGARRLSPTNGGGGGLGTSRSAPIDAFRPDPNDTPWVLPRGYIWPSYEAHPIPCPDGTTPEDEVSDYCVECSRPERSAGGLCDNLREVDVRANALLFGSTSEHGHRVARYGPTQVFYDTSYLNYETPADMRMDCYTCAALCLNISVDQFDTYTFTLPQLLEPDGKPAATATTCTKCALYCADLSGCSATCVPFETQIIIIAGVFLAVLFPLALVYFVCFRPHTLYVKSLDRNNITCANCSTVNPSDAGYCYHCGQAISPRGSSGESESVSTRAVHEHHRKVQ